LQALWFTYHKCLHSSSQHTQPSHITLSCERFLHAQVSSDSQLDSLPFVFLTPSHSFLPSLWPPLCLLQALSWSCLPRWFFYFYSLCFSVFSTARQSSEMFHSLCHPFCSSAHMIFVGAHWVVMLGRTFQGSYLVVPECLYKRNWHDNLVGREGLWLVLEWTFITSTSFLLPL
jgi:hypothetical protein